MKKDFDRKHKLSLIKNVTFCALRNSSFKVQHLSLLYQKNYILCPKKQVVLEFNIYNVVPVPKKLSELNLVRNHGQTTLSLWFDFDPGLWI